MVLHLLVLRGLLTKIQRELFDLRPLFVGDVLAFVSQESVLRPQPASQRASLDTPDQVQWIQGRRDRLKPSGLFAIDPFFKKFVVTAIDDNQIRFEFDDFLKDQADTVGRIGMGADVEDFDRLLRIGLFQGALQVAAINFFRRIGAIQRWRSA